MSSLYMLEQGPYSVTTYKWVLNNISIWYLTRNVSVVDINKQHMLCLDNSNNYIETVKYVNKVELLQEFKINTFPLYICIKNIYI